MKNIKKLYIVTIFTLGIIISVQSAFATPTDLTVKLDGKAITFPDAKPYVNEDSRTMVPVRFIAENLGCKVTWEETREIVIIAKGDTRILLHIGDNSAIVNTKTSDTRKTFDTKAVLKDDRTMVPLRFVSETLGAGVAWDEANNTVIIRSDGTVEALATPTPTATPSSTAFPDIVVDGSKFAPTPTPDNTIPVPTGTPSYLNPIPGNPYYAWGLTSKDDLSRYVRLQSLFKYDDIICIAGDDNNEDLGRVDVSYGCWNPYQKRYQGYMSVNARESSKSFMISIEKSGEKEFKRLKEAIDIAVIGDQDYKDFVYNTVMSCKDGFTGGTVKYTDGSNLYVKYENDDSCKKIWGDEAFFVTIWR